MFQKPFVEEGVVSWGQTSTREWVGGEGRKEVWVPEPPLETAIPVLFCYPGGVRDRHHLVTEAQNLQVHLQVICSATVGETLLLKSIGMLLPGAVRCINFTVICSYSAKANTRPEVHLLGDDLPE